MINTTASLIHYVDFKSRLGAAAAATSLWSCQTASHMDVMLFDRLLFCNKTLNERSWRARADVLGAGRGKSTQHNFSAAFTKNKQTTNIWYKYSRRRKHRVGLKLRDDSKYLNRQRWEITDETAVGADRQTDRQTCADRARIKFPFHFTHFRLSWFFMLRLQLVIKLIPQPLELVKRQNEPEPERANSHSQHGWTEERWEEKRREGEEKEKEELTLWRKRRKKQSVSL